MALMGFRLVFMIRAQSIRQTMSRDPSNYNGKAERVMSGAGDARSRVG